MLGPFLLELQHHHDGPDLVSGAGTVLHRADPGSGPEGLLRRREVMFMLAREGEFRP